MMDCWTVLGIEQTCNIATIKKAFARLLREYPPDKDARKYQDLRNAYKAAVAHAAGSPSAAKETYPGVDVAYSRSEVAIPLDSEFPKGSPDGTTDKPKVDLDAIKRIKDKFAQASVKVFATEEEALLYRQTCVWESIKRFMAFFLAVPAVLGFLQWYFLFDDEGSLRTILMFSNLLVGAFIFCLSLTIVRIMWPKIDYGPLMRKPPLTCLIVKHLFTVATVIVFYNLFKIAIVMNAMIRYDTSLLRASGIVTLILCFYERVTLKKDVVYDKE